ncbi:MAG: sensor histidine kinase [Solirubrobacterales bacterium]
MSATYTGSGAMARQDADRTGARQVAMAALEVVGAVGAATGLVAVLDEVAPVTGLGVLYVLAVMFVAVRRGQIAALVTALLSVTVLNFFFIEPRYRLTIADSHNVAALIAFLIAALVVGRLAAAARQQATEAERRATLAMAREREAMILADAASSLLAGRDLEAELASIGAGEPSSGGSARIGLTSAPERRGGELAVSLPASRPGWLYGRPDAGWDRSSLERLAEGLAGLIDVERERRRLTSQSAEAEATRRADVAKTALLHAISHDLRSPLTAITTAASALRSASLTREDRDALIEAIESESARLAGLVDDLLDLSRIEAHAVNPRTDWCDLADVVGRATAHAESRREHPIELDLPAALPLVRADAAQLERVFSNLLQNAIEFSPDNAPVRISGGPGAGKVTVRVTDRGRGIPRAKRAEIFEPFVRAHDGGHGSGLGLAICRGLVEANGGEIRLESATGHETTFAVSFPLVAQPAEAR